MHEPSRPTARTVRSATAEDVDAVRRLTRAAYAKWVAVIGREPLPMVADQHAAVRNHWVDLLFVDGEMVGLIEMIPEADHLLIENVAIQPASQGRGFGRFLMAHAETVARREGFQQLRLYTNQAFASNVPFYAALGYGIDRREEFRGGITVYMSKLL